MNLIKLSRAAAAAVSLGTFAFLFVSDAWNSDNLFLVPDLVACVLLLAAAAAPPRWATPMLILGFGLSAGVLGTAVSSCAVQGRLGVGPDRGSARRGDGSAARQIHASLYTKSSWTFQRGAEAAAMNSIPKIVFARRSLDRAITTNVSSDEDRGRVKAMICSEIGGL